MNKTATARLALCLIALLFATLMYAGFGLEARQRAKYEALVQDCVNYGYPRFRCEAVLYKLR